MVNLDYPIYRKYVGVNVWFKIINNREFIELKKVGQRLVVEHVKALQYPEMLRIQDMIECTEGRWELADSREVEVLLSER
ncbi:hypothetical protein [Crocinitomix algicola]|uniref:hypothetical protein n=1 Tax=Crocinitomix algicola TaxID=1740263 RepID=UPI0008725065|nr:hypothetical protein [Crocinitomix algicola]